MSSVNELTAAVAEILIDEDTLQGRIAELGAEISEDYRGRDLLLVGVLKGAVFFMADLMRRIDIHCRYTGFDIPNKFVIGYGLDFAERYRNLPFVAVIRDELAAQAEEMG